MQGRGIAVPAAISTTPCVCTASEVFSPAFTAAWMRQCKSDDVERKDLMPPDRYLELARVPSAPSGRFSRPSRVAVTTPSRVLVRTSNPVFALAAGAWAAAGSAERTGATAVAAVVGWAGCRFVRARFDVGRSVRACPAPGTAGGLAAGALSPTGASYAARSAWRTTATGDSPRWPHRRAVRPRAPPAVPGRAPHPRPDTAGSRKRLPFPRRIQQRHLESAQPSPAGSSSRAPSFIRHRRGGRNRRRIHFGRSCRISERRLRGKGTDRRHGIIERRQGRSRRRRCLATGSHPAPRPRPGRSQEQPGNDGRRHAHPRAAGAAASTPADPGIGFAPTPSSRYLWQGGRGPLPPSRHCRWQAAKCGSLPRWRRAAAGVSAGGSTFASDSASRTAADSSSTASLCCRPALPPCPTASNTAVPEPSSRW